MAEAFDASRQAPLSVRKAMLAVALMDGFVDRLFDRSDISDILEFRNGIAADYPAIGIVMNIASHRSDGAKLLVASHTVPIEHYGELSVEDFMVSLYNDHSVQQLVIRHAGRLDQPALPVLDNALVDIGALQKRKESCHSGRA